MISGKILRAVSLVAGLASLCTCESPMPPEQFGAVALHIVSAPGGLFALDAGRVHVRGPTPKDINATPGTPVTIDQLLPGDYTVALEGLIANEVANFVQISVHVDAGRTTSTTVGSFPSFVPAITSLPSTGTSKAFTVGFSAVTGAQSYEVEAATDAGFTANHVTQATPQSPATVTVPTYDSYFVRVRAIDAFPGGRGRASPAQSIQIVAADLAISTPTLTVTPGSVAQGNVATLSSFTVVNQGTAASNPGVIGFYLSSDANLTSADTRLGGVNLGTLAPSATVTVPAQPLTIPAATTPASLFIGALVDETNQTPESDEGNNNKSTALVVKIVFQVTSVTPAQNATGVETGADVEVQFSDGVNAVTLADSSFKVSVGGTALSTRVVYDPSTRIARLSVPLLPASTYQATVTTAVQDTAGRPLASFKLWSFTTGTPQNITVGGGGRSPSLVLHGSQVHLVYEGSNGPFDYAYCPGSCTSANWTRIDLDVVGGAGSITLDGTGRLYVSYDRDGDLGYSTCIVSCTVPGNWPSIALVNNAQTGQTPSLVFDGARLHVMWIGSPSGNYGLKYATCAAGGVGCEDPFVWDTVLVDAAGDRDAPSLARDGSGQLHVSYAASSLGLRYATCPAATLNCAVLANWQKATIDPGVRFPFLDDKTTIAVDSTGQLHVAYFDSTSGNLKYATCAGSCTTAAGWQKLALASAGFQGGSPSLVIDKFGRLHVTYYNSDTRALKYTTCAAACTAPAHWQTATVDQQNPPGDVGATSALELDSAGRLHAAYEDRTDPLNRKLKYIEF